MTDPTRDRHDSDNVVARMFSPSAGKSATEKEDLSWLFGPTQRTHTRRPARSRLGRLALTSAFLLSPFVALASHYGIRGAAADSLVTVVGVATNNSSVKIQYKPVPGATDYRAYDVSNPKSVKYAGIIHPNGASIPNTEIEWNDSGDGKPHTLVVQAVDQIGPIPPANQYDEGNQSLVMPMAPGAMLGANRGATPDGNVSTNAPSEHNP